MRAAVLLALVAVATATCYTQPGDNTFVLTRTQRAGVGTSTIGATFGATPTPVGTSFNFDTTDDITIQITTRLYSSSIRVAVSIPTQPAPPITFTSDPDSYIDILKTLSISTSASSTSSRLVVINNNAMTPLLEDTQCSLNAPTTNLDGWMKGDTTTLSLSTPSTIAFSAANIDTITLTVSSTWYGEIYLTLPMLTTIYNKYNIICEPLPSAITFIFYCTSPTACTIQRGILTGSSRDYADLISFDPSATPPLNGVANIQLNVGPIDGYNLTVSTHTPFEGDRAYTIELPTPVIVTDARIILGNTKDGVTTIIDRFMVDDGVGGAPPTVDTSCSTPNMATDFASFMTGDQTTPFDFSNLRGVIQLNPCTVSNINVVIDKTTTYFELAVMIPDPPAASPFVEFPPRAHTHIPIIGATVGSVIGFIVILATIIAAVKVTKAKHRAYSLVVNSN